ncbi:S8 family peptidase [Sinorhizobium meliloti]|uniref:S8 family peptidase n=1 Tax=Rhizobium meliloti TaxID=382 RepID=UPI001300C2F1|nr:S8 family serine peptidase [Sinorhizobium meliloti]
MYRTITLLGLATISSIAVVLPTHGQSTPFTKSGTALPSKDTSAAIEQLGTVGVEEWKTQRTQPRELTADPEGLDPAGRAALEMSGEQTKSVPFVVPNSMIIQFKPSTTAEQIEDYVKSKNVEVIQTFPNIGAIQIEVDISQYFEPRLSDQSSNDAILRGVTTAISEFRKDSRVHAATPDILLTDKSGHDPEADPTSALPPETAAPVAAMAGEVMDWGVSDIEADQLWNMPGARDGAILGVLDVGFSRHTDLIFLGLPPETKPDNHGNHVAGIGCGLHNGKGVQGVLPNCFVRARAGDVFFEAMGGNPELRFMVLFGQILSTLDRFVLEQSDIRTFNVSLGYNWRRNFGINPDLPESSQWRTLVEMQGLMLVTVLERADQSGKVIFSAAGNDSSGLGVPIQAKYASPFNWAAITARERGIADNGYIVGAHGSNGSRAGFSNSGAQISCPGVNVLSAVAFDANSQPSDSAYGKMSGTSMASPYCAAAHVLLKLVRPGYTGAEIARCMLATNVNTDDGTPRLKLTQALAACPPRG